MLEVVERLRERPELPVDVPERLHDLRLVVQLLDGRRVRVVAGGEGAGARRGELPGGKMGIQMLIRHVMKLEKGLSKSQWPSFCVEWPR